MAHHLPIRKPGAPRTPPLPGTPAEIPDKLYFRIGEVARLCAVPAYVLRFWESEFPQLKPNKGGTGQRLFRRRDVEMALRIKRLLYDEGYTIPGARQLLKTEVREKEPQLTLLVAPPERLADAAANDPRARQREAGLRALRHELQRLHTLLQTSPGTSVSRSRSPRPAPSLSTAARLPLRAVPATDRLFDALGSTSTEANTGSTNDDGV